MLDVKYLVEVNSGTDALALLVHTTRFTRSLIWCQMHWQME